MFLLRKRNLSLEKENLKNAADTVNRMRQTSPNRDLGAHRCFICNSRSASVCNCSTCGETHSDYTSPKLFSMSAKKPRFEVALCVSRPPHWVPHLSISEENTPNQTFAGFTIAADQQLTMTQGKIISIARHNRTSRRQARN